MTRKKPRIGWILAIALFGWGSTLGATIAAHAQMIAAKRCSACGQNVPLTSHAGNRCPFCAAYWGSEQTHETPNSGRTIYIPRPRNSLERIALYQTLVQLQLIERQMFREQIAQHERAARRQRMTEWAEKQREQDRARRERNYDLLRIENDRARGPTDRARAAK